MRALVPHNLTPHEFRFESDLKYSVVEMRDIHPVTIITFACPWSLIGLRSPKDLNVLQFSIRFEIRYVKLTI